MRLVDFNKRQLLWFFVVLFGFIWLVILIVNITSGRFELQEHIFALFFLAYISYGLIRIKERWEAIPPLFDRNIKIFAVIYYFNVAPILIFDWNGIGEMTSDFFPGILTIVLVLGSLSLAAKIFLKTGLGLLEEFIWLAWLILVFYDITIIVAKAPGIFKQIVL